MQKILIYEVKREYIDYLRETDSKVPKEKDHAGAKTRKYIGVILQINNCDYFAPLTSPKKKFRNMKNDKDFLKIQGGKYGAINLNNMIPVHSSALVEYDIMAEQDSHYQDVLRNQSRFIRKNTSLIMDTANELYEIITGTDKANENEQKRLIGRCCDFKKLEEASKKYTK